MKTLKFQMDEYWTQHSIQTMLFYAVIVILVLLFITLFLVLKAYWQHKRHQQMLVVQNKLLAEQSLQQKEMNRRLNEATRSKLNFYTNVSHDLRTPLTLISEPVAQLAAADNLTPRQLTLIRIANKNVKILRRLINQILDFRKYEAGKLELHPVEMNLTEAVAEWTEAFREATRRRDIKLELEAPAEPVHLAVDAEKMERIFFNLLGNAVKYTPDNGTIRVRYAVEGEQLHIDIADTGRGIAAEDLPSIFERFYQVEHVRPQGSGIGLSLVKAFVELHGGTITVQSAVGHGTTFSILMPVQHVEEEAPAGQRVFTTEEVTTALSTMEAPDNIADGERPQLLVIDDNEDIRLLIAELLGDVYEIHQAGDGREGLAKAARLVPDLIICDVMMPVMDGLECCRRIKEEVSTSHIPVLMLTACSQDEQRLEGYKSGADGYLSKPFDGEMLRARCQNLIDNRKRIHETPKKDETTAAGPTDPEDEFYARFLKLFYEHISDPDLSIEQLASGMGLGHSQFYRKLKALTNYTPVELMRRLRLKQGRQLLTTTSKSVSEIAYEVGFASPAYFTKCYRAEFGETPTERRDNLGQKP
jgi:signal transduction histidine kinase/DNA-binding NarL/FixJ family response regulator